MVSGIGNEIARAFVTMLILAVIAGAVVGILGWHAGAWVIAHVRVFVR